MSRESLSTAATEEALCRIAANVLVGGWQATKGDMQRATRSQPPSATGSPRDAGAQDFGRGWAVVLDAVV